jgi:cbb3-type cytochrome oxidase subunit 3
MFQEYYANSSLLIWPLVGLIIFVAIFTGVLAYVFLGLRDKSKIDELAALPLDTDTDEGHAEGRAT